MMHHSRLEYLPTVQTVSQTLARHLLPGDERDFVDTVLVHKVFEQFVLVLGLGDTREAVVPVCRWRSFSG